MPAPRPYRSPPNGLVPAVYRGAHLLDLLAEARVPMSLAALTSASDLPRSTVHGLCATLVHAGLVARRDDGGYQLGARIMDLAHAFLAQTDITSEFVRTLDDWALLPEETIVLSVLDGVDVVYLACRNGTRPLGYSFRIGMRLPACCTASGKALLSTLAPERVRGLYRHAEFRRLTRRSVTGVPALLKQLATFRRRGYTIDEEETRDGMICYGAPIYGARHEGAIAAVAVSMLSARLSKAESASAIAAVTKVAATLSQRLGGRSTAEAVSG